VCELASHEDVLPVLEQLVDKSLVLFEDGPARYRMLETVRHYAIERLEAAAERERVLRRHFEFYLTLADQARSGLVGEQRARWLAVLDAERENILAAHAWAQGEEVEACLALRLASSMKRYWIERGLLELGERVTREALDRPAARDPGEDRCRALFDVGQLLYFMGRHREARRDLEESLAIARNLGSIKKIAAVLQPLGMAALGEGELELARSCLREALALARSLDDARDIARAANALGQLQRLEGAPQEAAQLFEETIRISRAQGDREMAAVGALNLAMVSMDREDGAFAASCIREALEAAQADGSLPLLKSALEAAAGLAARFGDDLAAARFYGAAEAQAAKSGLRRDPADAAFLEPLVEASRARLGRAAFAAIEAEGGALEEAQAADDARQWLARHRETTAATYR
jgi:tetratricopeptide (TPR) repeat protein